MNKSYSKIRHIQESNQILEKRILSDKKDKFGLYEQNVANPNQSSIECMNHVFPIDYYVGIRIDKNNVDIYKVSPESDLCFDKSEEDTVTMSARMGTVNANIRYNQADPDEQWGVWDESFFKKVKYNPHHSGKLIYYCKKDLLDGYQGEQNDGYLTENIGNPNALRAFLSNNFCRPYS